MYKDDLFSKWLGFLKNMTDAFLHLLKQKTARILKHLFIYLFILFIYLFICGLDGIGHAYKKLTAVQEIWTVFLCCQNQSCNVS